MTTLRCGLTILVVMLTASVTSAQDPDPAFRSKHIVASIGVASSNGFSVGDIAAELRRNATGTPAPLPLFNAESLFGRAVGVDARVAVALTRLLAIEVGTTYATPELAISITQDLEAPTPPEIVTKTTQYTVDVSGVLQIPGLHLGRRIRPYLIGGGGYLRQLPEGRLVVEAGRTIHIGGGIRYWLYGGGAGRRAVGARAEARAVRRNGGINFDNDSRVHPAFSILAFVGF